MTDTKAAEEGFCRAVEMSDARGAGAVTVGIDVARQILQALTEERQELERALYRARHAEEILKASEKDRNYWYEKAEEERRKREEAEQKLDRLYREVDIADAKVMQENARAEKAERAAAVLRRLKKIRKEGGAAMHLGAALDEAQIAEARESK